MRLCLFQPEIPPNTGTLLRLAACMNVGVDIIEPCGFIFGDKSFRRAAMDYLPLVEYKQYPSWDEYVATKPVGRLIALDGRGVKTHLEMRFQRDDILMLGSEGRGLPKDVLAAVPDHVRIPMAPGLRSLNVAIAGAMVLNEALRQTDLFPCVSL